MKIPIDKFIRQVRLRIALIEHGIWLLIKEMQPQPEPV